MTNFPCVTIEVSGGVAELTERSAGVEVTIVDHDNEAVGAERCRDHFPALYDDCGHWELEYRGGEMTAYVPREIAVTLNDAVRCIKQERPEVIVIANGWYTHDDMWEEAEL